jgi:hypothetical protein
MMLRMNLSRSFRDLGNQVEEAIGLKPRHPIARNLGLAAAGVTVVALGLVVGRELRQRYKFSRRTPYDAYAHSGDRIPDVEFGVGI